MCQMLFKIYIYIYILKYQSVIVFIVDSNNKYPQNKISNIHCFGQFCTFVIGIVLDSDVTLIILYT